MSGQGDGTGDNPFFFQVLNAEPRKGTGALDLPYWVYRIRIRTTLPEYPRKEMEVVRRYSDFEWFRSQLCEANPYCIIPPIPEKDFYGTFEKIKTTDSRGAVQLREYRQRALKNFLRRLGAHPRLRFSRLLQDFLELDEFEWERKMKDTSKNMERTFSTTIGEGVNHAFAGQWNMTSGIKDLGSGYTHVINGNTNPQIWEETRLYIHQLEDSIKMLRERLQMLVDRRRNTSNALHEFGEAFEKVGEVEKGIESTPLSNTLIAVGRHSEQLSSVYIDQSSDERKQVVEVLHYYTGMCAAVRETLKRVQTANYHVEVLENKVTELHTQREKAINKMGQAERVARLDNEIALTEGKRDAAKKELEMGEGIFKEELRRFHHHKQHDVKGFLKAFAELQLKYAARMRENWERLRPTVEQIQINSDTGVREGASQQKTM